MSAPPPPPPPPMTLSADNANQTTYFVKHAQSNDDMEAELRQNMESVHASSNRGDPDEKLVMMAFLSPVQPILQIGPVCGLVAVGMAADYFSTDGATPALDAIFKTAKSENMTRSGEMFSAQEMRDLAAMVIPGVNADLVNSESPDAVDKVMSTLLYGDLVLVPYDADHNHSPANRKGHAAHWALLIGFGILLPRQEAEMALGLTAGHRQTTSEHGVIFLDTLTSTEKKGISDLIKQRSRTNQVFLCARQGKSKHIGLWTWDDLIQSNQNLIEVGGKIKENSDGFVIHPIDLTLRSKLILLQKNSSVQT